MANKRMFLEDYLFRGKYEEMARALTSVIDVNSGSKIFNSGVELYMTAAIVGAAFGLRSEPVSGDKTFRIMANQFTNHGNELLFIFKVVMLSANKETDENIDRINNAFKYTSEDEEYQKNAKVFEEYMLGGLTELYNSFILSTNKRYEDYLTSLNRFVDRFKKQDDTVTEEIDLSGDIF